MYTCKWARQCIEYYCGPRVIYRWLIVYACKGAYWYCYRRVPPVIFLGDRSSSSNPPPQQMTHARGRAPNPTDRPHRHPPTPTRPAFTHGTDLVDGLEVAHRVGRRAVDDVDDDAAALDVPEEGAAQPCSPSWWCGWDDASVNQSVIHQHSKPTRQNDPTPPIPPTTRTQTYQGPGARPPGGRGRPR